MSIKLVSILISISRPILDVQLSFVSTGAGCRCSPDARVEDDYSQTSGAGRSMSRGRHHAHPYHQGPF